MGLKLSYSEKLSPLWITLVDHYEERLAYYRTQNEGDKSPEETAKLRGRIDEIKKFLALSKEEPPMIDGNRTQ